MPQQEMNRPQGSEGYRHVAAGHGEQRTYSPRGIAADGTYVGHAGGYVGHAIHGGRPADGHGEGTYGYPFGQGIGLAFERHPDDEARVFAASPPPMEVSLEPGGRFGAGRTAEWVGDRAYDPGLRETELIRMRNAHGRRMERDFREPLERRRTLAQMIADWRERRHRDALLRDGVRSRGEDRGEDSGF
jgi:hypothetical protein